MTEVGLSSLWLEITWSRWLSFTPLPACDRWFELRVDGAIVPLRIEALARLG